MKSRALLSTLGLCLCTAVAVGADTNSQSTASTDTSRTASAEQSHQDLKVSEQEMSQEVTDANKASKFIGMTVKNKQDETLGTIKDLALDLKSGKIGYVVLSHGGILGYGGKYVAVPVQALTLKPGEKALLLDLPKQQIAQAPGFNDNDWPTLDAASKGKTIGLAQPTSGQQAQSSTNRSGLSLSSIAASATNSAGTDLDSQSSTNTAAGGATLDDESESSSDTEREGKSSSDDASSGESSDTNSPSSR